MSHCNRCLAFGEVRVRHFLRDRARRAERRSSPAHGPLRWLAAGPNLPLHQRAGCPNGLTPFTGRAQVSSAVRRQRYEKMDPKAKVTLDYQSDGTAWGGTSLVQDADDQLFIEHSGCDHDGNFSSRRQPWDEARASLQPHVWIKAVREVARLQGRVDVSDDELVSSLLTLMESRNGASQDWAIRAVTSIGSSAIPQLVRVLVGDSPVSASVATRALIALGDEAIPAVPLLIVAYSNSKSPARDVLMGVLAQIKLQDGVIKTIIGLAVRGYERDRLMSEARRLLEEQTDADELARLLSDALRQSDQAVRKGALLALYQLGHQAAVAAPAVRELLATEADALIRRMANNALKEMG